MLVQVRTKYLLGLEVEVALLEQVVMLLNLLVEQEEMEQHLVLQHLL